MRWWMRLYENIKQEEAEQAVVIEQVCFPQNEACSELTYDRVNEIK